MKMKNCFFAILSMAVVSFASCSNDNEDFNDELGKSAYLSLNLIPNSSSQTRAGSDVTGSTEESGITKATAYLFDASQTLVKVINYSGTTLSYGETGSSITHKANAVLVPASTKYAFVVTGDFTPATTPTIGLTTFNALNAAIKPAISTVIGDKNFMMTNDGSATGVEGLVDVSSNLKDDATTADATPGQIKVNRVVAKVEVKVNAALDVKPAGAKATILGWCLDRTSKEFYPYAKKDAALTSSIYRMCPTYNTATRTIVGAPTTYLNVSAEDYGNVFTTELLPATAVTTSTPASEYCYETTMPAALQQTVRTTAVLVKAFYRPKKDVFHESNDDTYTKGNSYFVYGGMVYTLTQIKANAATQFDQLIADIKTAGGSSALSTSSSEADWNAIEAKYAKNTTSGITFYQAGLNYFRVLVRHDDTVTGAMELGRYGVVRNNWYVLTINSIEGPANPWTPEPGDDEDDDIDKWLAVDILVNPWTQWSQGVDL